MNPTSKLLTLIVFLSLALSAVAGHRELPEPTASTTFVRNMGQVLDLTDVTRPDVLAKMAMSGAEVYLRKTGMSYVFIKQPDPIDACSSDDDSDEAWLNTPLELHRLDMELIGSAPDPVVEYDFVSAFNTNYYLAHCPNGIKNVASYRQITYKNVYPNIDFVVYVHQGQLKFDFVVHPGGDPADIAWRYDAADAVTLNPNGSIKVETPLGSIEEGAVYSFQDNETVISNYVLNQNTVRVNVGNYDPNKVLVIDPLTLIWSSYIGGSSSERHGSALATDGTGTVFMSGTVLSTNFPTTAGAFQTSNAGSYDTYFAKWNATGQLIFSTYYGGSGTEVLNYRMGLYCDLAGNVWMSGKTGSSNFPVTAGAHQTTFGGGQDMFLIKWTNAGARLWATFYGGTGSESTQSTEVVADAAGNGYLMGFTTSSNNIATAGAYQTTLSGSADMFLAKFNAAGVRQWATYFGGTGDERSFTASAQVDLSGNIWTSAMTTSTNIPVTAGAHQTTSGGGVDAFLVKWTNNGNLLYSTYYGGTGYENLATGLTVDGFNNIWMSGASDSPSGITTPGAYQVGNNGAWDLYLVKFNNNGVRQFATHWGGSSSEETWGCVQADAGNNVWIGTSTFSTNMPLLNPLQPVHAGGSSEWALAHFDNAGNLLEATYWGGTGYDDSQDMVVDATGSLWMSGIDGAGFPTTAGVHQTTVAGGNDNGITRFNTGIVLDHETVLSADQLEEAIDLHWETTYNGEMEVQRSIDLENGLFSTIGSTVTTDFRDANPAFNTNMYYRLKYIDADQQTNYSNIVHVRLSSEVKMSVVPNPVGSDRQVHIYYDAPQGTAVRVSVKNSLGQLVGEVQQSAPAGGGEVVLSTQNYARGVYFVSLHSQGRVTTEKLVVR